MKTLYLMVGLPASGKSTFVDSITKSEDYNEIFFVYSTDRYLENEAKHRNTTYDAVFQEYMKDATHHMDKHVQVAYRNGVDIFWDQTNLGLKKRKAILSKVPADYRKICYCRVPPRNEEEWAELNRRLLSREGKTIPEFVIHSMHKSFFTPSVEEGFDEVIIQDIYGNNIKKD